MITHVPPDIEIGDAVRRLEHLQIEAWNNGDGNAFAATFTEDADFVAFDGSHLAGREGIAASMREGLSGFMKGTTLTAATRVQPRMVTPDLGVVVSSGNCVLPPGESDCRQSRLAIQTRVLVRTDEGWLHAAFHNSRLHPFAGDD